MYLLTAWIFLLISHHQVLSTLSIKKFRKIRQPSVGISPLEPAWKLNSLISCGRKCLEIYPNDCRSFIFNSITGDCTPGSTANSLFPPPGSQEGHLYHIGTCTNNRPFRFLSRGETTTCLAEFVPPLPYINASDACESRGGFLVSVKTLAKHSLLKQLIRGVDAWIGLNDISEEGTFVWAEDGTRVSETTMKMFRMFEPNNLHDEDCCSADYKSARLNDFSCALFKRYVCEIAINS